MAVRNVFLPCAGLSHSRFWAVKQGLEQAHDYPVQVTNPPIDPLREGLVMSLAVRLGKRGNLLEPGPHAYTQVSQQSACLASWSVPACCRRGLFGSTQHGGLLCTQPR